MEHARLVLRGWSHACCIRMKGDAMSGEVRRGFTIYELLAVIVVVVLLIGISLPAIGYRSGCSINVVAQANLRSLNTGAANFAADNEDRLFHFNWDRNTKTHSLRSASWHKNYFETDQEAHGAELQNILQRATGRIQGQGNIREPAGINLSIRYSHLVLLDYLTDRQPEPIAASPFDKNLIKWQEHPLGYLDADSDVPYGKGMPKKAGYDTGPMWLDDSVKQLWAFGSSYQVVPHAWLDDADPQYTPSAESPHHLVKGESEQAVGGRRMSEVAHPAAKVFMYEEFDRFSDPDGIYAAYPKAKINMAFFDGSVRQEVVGDANSAFNTERPDAVWEQSYVPLDTFPHPLGGLGDQTKLDLRFRWTKGGLSGIDYD